MTTTTTLPNIAKGEGTNPLKGLLAYGQSPWMDYVRRDLLTSGQLKKYIDNDGLRGMTSNPAIFEKAVTGSNLYADILNSPEAVAFRRDLDVTTNPTCKVCVCTLSLGRRSPA